MADFGPQLDLESKACFGPLQYFGSKADFGSKAAAAQRQPARSTHPRIPSPTTLQSRRRSPQSRRRRPTPRPGLIATTRLPAAKAAMAVEMMESRFARFALAV